MVKPHVDVDCEAGVEVVVRKEPEQKSLFCERLVGQACLAFILLPFIALSVLIPYTILVKDKQQRVNVRLAPPHAADTVEQVTVTPGLRGTVVISWVAAGGGGDAAVVVVEGRRHVASTKRPSADGSRAAYTATVEVEGLPSPFAFAVLSSPSVHTAAWNLL